jgi:ABC-2 type transport system permease protein
MIPTARLPTTQPVTAGRARMVANEFTKVLRLRWAYRGTVIPELVSGIALYMIAQYFVGGGTILDDLVAETAPAMFAFLVGYGTIMRLVSGVLEERNAGTLEQTHLSPLPAWQLATGRLVAALLESVAVGAVATAAVLVILGVGYPADAQALVPLGLMIAGIAGLALLIAAASFTYPGIGALVHILQMLIMAVNGMIIPVEQFPHGLELIAKLVPTTLGIAATRRILVDGDSLANLAGDGALGWLLLHTVMLVVAGWAAYQWQVRRALRDGKLGPA